MLSAGCDRDLPAAGLEVPSRVAVPAQSRIDAATARGDERAVVDALAPLYRRLALLEAGRAEHVVVLQLGDSHTAGGIIAERLRELLQAQFGAAGRGMMVPGRAYPGIRQSDLKLSEVGRWQYTGSLKPDAEGPFGLTGYRAKSRGAGATLVLESIDERGFDRVGVEFLRGPGRGALEVVVDGRPVRRIATEARALEPASITLQVPPGSRELRLIARDRAPVELLSWTIERRGRGVLLEAHGVSGAMADIVSRWDPAIVARELRERDPALILLAYGTNEAVKPDLDPARYEDTLRQLQRQFRAAVPGAALLLIGAPDVNQALGCARGAAPATCAPPGAASGQCRWSAPPLLGAVREAQVRAAQLEGAYFWDWFGLMGGTCGMHRWTQAEPPLARADHVHLTLAGYRATAEALYETLMRGYAAYRRAPAARR